MLFRKYKKIKMCVEVKVIFPFVRISHSFILPIDRRSNMGNSRRLCRKKKEGSRLFGFFLCRNSACHHRNDIFLEVVALTTVFPDVWETFF